MYSVIRGLYALLNIPLQVMCDSRAHQLKETIPSLGEVGGHQLYPADAAAGTCLFSASTPSASDLNFNTNSLADRRVALSTILKSMLVTYSSFLGALLAPPPSATSNAPPEWHRQVEWITILAQNIMAAANDLRPVQVRFLK